MSSSDPMIFSADSLMFESGDNLVPTTSAIDFNHRVHVKHEEAEELSSHLPVIYEDVPVTNAVTTSHEDSTSPFEIHSAVLDSVFSTAADDAQFQDNTPMFDELDLIVDGMKPNSKDDWVSLFGGDEKPFESIPKDTSKRLFSEIEETFEFVPMKSVAPTAEQLETPISSTFNTPVLDGSSTSKSVSSDKLDHLGCVSYSKKQRTQALEPVEHKDTSDPVLLKRARNTEAARRSRARKMERMSQLEDKVESLITDKTNLENEVMRLKEMLVLHGINF